MDEQAKRQSRVGMLIDAYKRMALIRATELAIVAQYEWQRRTHPGPMQEIRCPTHLSVGQEAVAAGVCMALKVRDVVFSTHRCHGHYLAKGGRPLAMMAELFGKSTGCAKGRGGSMHLVDPSVGMMGSSAIVGGSIALAAGAALAFSLRKLPHVAVAFFGDGAVEEGIFHETLQVAALRRLPVIFVCENNSYATLSRIDHRQITPIAMRAQSYGMNGVALDGNSVEMVYSEAESAVRRARLGAGPTLLECHTYRWYAHVGTEPDTGKMHRTTAELKQWQDRCPIAACRVRLLEEGVSPELIQTFDEDIETVVAQMMIYAKQSPMPDVATLLEGV